MSKGKNVKSMEVVDPVRVEPELRAAPQEPELRAAPQEAEPIELSPQEQELLRRNRAKMILVKTTKDKIDSILTNSGCVLKVNPNSPIGAPQILVDVKN